MKVLILDTLLRQASHNEAQHSKLTRDVINMIHKEYANLASLEKSGEASLRAYIQRQDGKPMIGVKGVYKYRLTDGDRIIYTRGHSLGYLAEEDKESIVLLAYAKHDEQERVAIRVAPGTNPGIEHDYVSVQQLAALANEIDFKLDAEEFDLEAQQFLYEYLLDPSVVQAHRIYVVPDDEYLNLDPERQDVALSETQAQVVRSFSLNPCPTLILGGAGTGKTVICKHILNGFDNTVDRKTGIYFTQSQELLGKVESDLQYLPHSDNKNDILLYDINEYCLDLLGLSRKQLVETRQFMSFIDDNPAIKDHCKSNGLDPISVWTEIRGTIKGYMGKTWIRVAPISQNEFSGGISNLVRRGYLKRFESDKRLIALADSISNTISRANSDIELTNNDRKNIQKACEHFNTFDYQITSMEKSQYLNMDNEDTTIEFEMRPAIWIVYEAYTKWLSSNNLFDENDLILNVFGKYEKQLPVCDLVIVDEVQDYTELQLYLLFKLADHQHGTIVFAGDVNQNVNPTYFSEDHLKLLFLKNGGPTLRIVHLSSNFRCSCEIVDIANKLSGLRKKYIASHSIENETPETAKRFSQKPYRLERNDANLKNLLETMMNYPRVAVLVPNLSTKEYLISLIGKERYEKDSLAHFVFTVSEIKGMEYAYVVCFNLSGFYSDVWKTILDKGAAKKKTKYRYYFNLLYVATTRAERYLCFIDDNLNKTLEEGLQLENVQVFDEAALYFTSLSKSSEEQLRQAAEFFRTGHYEDALHIYNRIGLNEDIYKCKQRIAEENHNFEEGLKYHMLLDPWEGYRFVREVDPKSSLRAMHDSIYGSSNRRPFRYADVIEQYYSDSTNQMSTMQDYILERLNGELLKSIDHLKALKIECEV